VFLYKHGRSCREGTEDCGISPGFVKARRDAYQRVRLKTSVLAVVLISTERFSRRRNRAGAASGSPGDEKKNYPEIDPGYKWEARLAPAHPGVVIKARGRTAKRTFREGELQPLYFEMRSYTSE